MEFVPERVRKDASLAETADLLERVTIQRDELEPEALTIIMQELLARNITPETVLAYEKSRQGPLCDARGYPRICMICHRPAVSSKKGWFRLFRIVPVVPITEYYCEAHTPIEVGSPNSEANQDTMTDADE